MARKLADWLKAYLEYTQYSESPDRFHFFVGLSVLGSALRRKAYFNMGYYTWSPNLYIILVAPSGVVAKSTTIRLGASLLRTVPGVHIGPNNLTWQALPMTLAQAAKTRPVGDGTTVTESCVSFIASEFGTFLDPKDQGLLNVLVDLYDGQEPNWRKRTKGGGDENVQNPWISILAGTTPAWIAENMSQYFIGGGFTSRCICVYADKKRFLDAYPLETIQKHMTNETFSKLRKELEEDLKIISEIEGTYTLTPEAMILGKEWYEKTHTDKGLRLRLGQFDGYLSRRQSHAHVIALILTAARTDVRIIDVTTLTAAFAILEDIEKDMPNVLSGVERGSNSKYIEAILAMFDIMPEIEYQALYTVMFRRFGIMNQEFVPVYQSMISAGMLEEVGEGFRKKVKRKKPN